MPMWGWWTLIGLMALPATVLVLWKLVLPLVAEWLPRV